MKVQDISLNNFLAMLNTRFVIPVYQRNYAWERAHCKKLLEDMLIVIKKQKGHFLGTVTYILHYSQQGFGNVEQEYVIIDGQQRITTLMLLLKALQATSKNEQVKSTIENYIKFGANNLSNLSTDKETESKLRLKPIKKDKEALDFVMNDKWNEFGGKSKIIDNYYFFLKEVERLSREGILPEQICAAFNYLNVVAIGLEPDKGDDDPQAVFESINATGLHLEGVDLIRNFLMMNQDSINQEKLFDNYWAKIEDILGEEKIISDFVEVYLRLYFERAPLKEGGKVYEYFKLLTNRETKGNKIGFNKDKEVLMGDLVKYAKIYKIIIDKQGEYLLHDPYENPKEKHKILTKIALMRKLDLVAAYPFVMRLIDDFQNGKLDSANLYEMLNVIISYVVRRKICGVDKSTNYTLEELYRRLSETFSQDLEKQEQDSNQIYFLSAELLKRNLGARNDKNLFPNNEFLKTRFLQCNAYKKVFLIIFLEIEKMTNKEAPNEIDLTLEHFYPKSPTKHWRELVGEEANELEKDYLHTFGNLTLINKGTNSKMGNKKFEDKIRILEEASGLHINRIFNSFDSWGIKEILHRGKWLYERFIQLEFFKDLDAPYRSLAKEVITLNSDWNFLQPFAITFPDESSKKVSSIREIAHCVIEWILANYASEFEELISRDCPKCISTEVKEFPENANVVEYNFGDFMFYSHASGQSIQSNIQKIVEGIGLDLDDFEIDGIYRY